jgi:CIC family chloride channel protein
MASASPLNSSSHPAPRPEERLRDFNTDRRLLILMAIAPVIGTAGAGAAWCLLHLITVCTNLAYHGRLSTAPASMIDNIWGFGAVIVPAIGCLLIGIMARYGSEKIRGHGIPEAMEAILIGRSRISPKVALLKPLSSAISIGTGGPFGAEGPIIMTGGAFGSLFAQLFHLSNAERKTLLVAGAAAGMSATFGTPVAAMLLAVELLLFEWKPRSFVPVAIAAAVAAAWRPLILDGGVLFPMAPSIPLPALGLLSAAGLGVLAGLASGLLTAMVYGCEDLFQRLPIHWMWWPVLGGLVIGAGGLVEPHALGVGYDMIAAMLHNELSSPQTIRLAAVKAVIWAVALGSGTSGGVLAPLLIMGGALGSLFGQVATTGTPALWALIGMAAIMGGTMRSPLTAIIFALELTHNIDALLPLAIACAFAHATTVLLMRRSILTEKVARHGHHVMREYIVDPFETIRVRDVMATPVDTLPCDMPVKDAIGFLVDANIPTHHRSYPVIDGNTRVIGMVSRADALRWTVDHQLESTTLGDVAADRDVLIGYEDELVGRLADRMAQADVARVPILRREDGTLVGLMARRDLLRVRANANRHEDEREILLKLGRQPRRPGPIEQA